jgi:hypothetical protein
MAKIGVSLKINVSQIDKARLFSGQKGKYLDATVFIDIDQLDQYGNSGMITQDVSKEEKGQNVRGAILGNCKVFWNDNQNSAPQPSRAPQQQQAVPQQQQYLGGGQTVPQQQPAKAPDLDDGWDDDIPF